MSILIKSKINAYILAGGLSKRFGSNKAIYKINGVTFLDRIFTTLQSDFTKIFSIGKESYSEKMEFVSDFSDCQAPIVGIITALRHTTSLWNFIISVDMPYITSDIVYKLKKEIIGIDNNIVIPSVKGRILPLSGLYHKNCLIYFERAYLARNYTLMNVISSLRPTVVDLSQYSMKLKNINTFEQLRVLDKNTY